MALSANGLDGHRLFHGFQAALPICVGATDDEAVLIVGRTADFTSDGPPPGSRTMLAPGPRE
jgi:hypothetical protein